MKLFRDILTCSDNTTYDCGRCMYLVSHMVYVAMGFISFVNGTPWTAMDFASGISTMTVAFGAHLFMKKGTEPHAH